MFLNNCTVTNPSENKDPPKVFLAVILHVKQIGKLSLVFRAISKGLSNKEIQGFNITATHNHDRSAQQQNRARGLANHTAEVISQDVAHIWI